MPENSAVQGYIARYQAERGKVKAFLSKFPFYGDVLKNHQYYDADRLARNELSKRIDSLKEPLRRVEEGFVRDRRMELIGSTEILLSLIERLKNEISGSSYGLNGLGSGFKASEAELEALAEWDYSLLQHTEELYAKASSNGLNATDSAETVRDWVSKFRSELDQFDEALKKRRDVFLKK
ncbi:hypothetical protein LEP1GSC050_2995 [Leptospira broomii serovar Hurstbridge str. 5399]|uniref:Uncharacterized protein n=1 Tax=Leptospira broomii serovar Hurstbridge str. 5399 TaxID=1049789 RepID=T0F9U0_9LEPT|nr:hypothetical protein [Leptospira broomii]EQA44656.1 hypothetical protein LEP1GSC050_2995 [Leptospira broomii serovar Hurstbridge str. 5399]